MTRRSTPVPLRLALLVACLLPAGLLGACGSGGAPPPADGGGTTQPPPDGGEPQPETTPPPPGTPWGTQAQRVNVKPLGLLALEEVLGELGGTLLGPVPGTLWYQVSVPEGRTPAGWVTELESDARILLAELDLGVAAPEGDGRTAPLGGFYLSVDLPEQEDLVRLGLRQAHQRTRGAGVAVAVLDSGVIADHPAVAGRIAPGGRDLVEDDDDPTEARNGLDDDQDGFTDEGWGHGTFVASLLLTVAPEATVVPVRVLGTDLFGTSSAVAAGIMHAIERDVQVVHLSIAVPPEVRILREAIQQARALGIVVVASAGNTGEEDVGTSGASADVFIVTALDPQDIKADFASYGPGVALAAPGVELHGAYAWDDPEAPDTARWSGTSFSAPLVSGAFALLREQWPLHTVDLLADRLKATAVDVAGANPGMEGLLGAGRLNLDAATAP